MKNMKKETMTARLTDEAFENENMAVAGLVSEQADAKNGELTEAELENVVGGGVIKGSLCLAASMAVAFGYGCACGVCPALGASATWVAGGLTAMTTGGYMSKGW